MLAGIDSSAVLLRTAACGRFLCYDNATKRTIPKTGILLVAYHRNPVVLNALHELVSQRAVEHKSTASRIPIAIATHNATDRLRSLFDYMIHIDDTFLFDAKPRGEGDPAPPSQWRTRLIYYASSPFETTLALDSDVAIMSDVKPLFDAFDGYDIAVPNQERDSKTKRIQSAWFPHNCVLMYKRNTRLFSRWWDFQLQCGR
jgi:hypothetical protein